MTAVTMTSLLTVLSLATLCCGLAVPRAQDAAGVMRLPVTRMQKTSTLARRQIETGLADPENGTVYVVDLEIGTPPQQVSVQIDTGSSDLWVDPTCGTAGAASQVAFCQSLPVYDPRNSSTVVDADAPMNLTYGKGACSGEYLFDTVSIGGATLQKQQFGYALESRSLPTGILGVGWGFELTGYYNFIDQLFLQGITQSRAFSLDLGNVDTAEGSIIFGGIDTMKYIGALEKRPIIPADLAPDGDRYWIYMTSVGITTPGSHTKTYTDAAYEQAVFLDSGGTLSRLPANLVESMVADFPGALNQGNGVYTVDCSYAAQAGFLEFGFGSTTIHVSFREFIWEPEAGVCVFGAVANAENDVDWVLGDTFLRAAYVVYDQDNRNLLLANSANCGTNVVPIKSGVDAVPSITGACTAATTPSGTTTASSSTVTPAVTSVYPSYTTSTYAA